MKKNLAPFLFLHITCYVLHTTSFAQDTIALHYSKNINAEDMSTHLHKLASDEFEGRETGQKGQRLAAEYIAKHFSSIGIPPYKGTSYFQQYPLSLKHIEGVNISSNNKKFELFKDYYYFPGLDDTLINAIDFVFLGYGINEKNYSDFNKNVDIRGKVVMVIINEPVNKKGISYITKTKERSDWTTKWKNHQVTKPNLAPCQTPLTKLTSAWSLTTTLRSNTYRKRKTSICTKLRPISAAPRRSFRAPCLPPPNSCSHRC